MSTVFFATLGGGWHGVPPPLFSCLQLIGKENEGFKGLMLNFNHERFVIAAQARGHR